MGVWSGPSLVAGPSSSNGRELLTAAPPGVERQETAAVQLKAQCGSNGLL